MPGEVAPARVRYHSNLRTCVWQRTTEGKMRRGQREMSRCKGGERRHNGRFEVDD